MEGGNENDYVYPSDPINRFDLDGNRGLGNPFKACDENHEGGTNIISGAIDKHKDALDSVASGGRAAGRWLNKNRWKVAGFVASGVCIAATAGGATVPCFAAAGVLLTAKTVSTARGGGSIGDHAYNFGSTGLLLLAGSGWAAAGFRGWAGAGAGLMSEVPSIACSSVGQCASPGLPG